MGKHSVPAGDEDLSGGRTMSGENITDGGAGPSGSSVTSTGRIGGMGNTSDGAGSRADEIDMADEETNGLTDRMNGLGLGDIVSEFTDADADGSALDGPGDPDDRPGTDDAPMADLLTADRLGGDRASGASSSRSPGQGETDVKVGSTDEMTGETGGQAGTSR